MPVVMGTAGHIDHGKTSLVRALTQIDCDRLEEEKRRGITIELGFAFLPLAEGRRLSIVDVPGHEKFVKTMVAGASGIDFVMLVIAADEGVMPQTREHLEICTLLGIRHGLVAVTKTDMVEPELLEMALEDIHETLAGTFLEHADIFPVSAHSGQGLDALHQALETMERELVPARSSDILRIPVDRIFSIKGHGTVITGTMISGSARVGDDVRLYPTALTAKVRSLQSHGESVTLAPAGRRTAVNLQGVDLDRIERGLVLAHTGELQPASAWELQLSCLASSPRAIRHRTELHFHHGTKEVMARVYLRDGDKLAPGSSGLAQIRFTEPMVGMFGDACILRSFSPLRTIAGAVLLHPLGLELNRRGNGYAQTLDHLRHLAAADDDSRCIIQIELAGAAGVSFAQLRLLTAFESKRLEKIISLLSTKQQIFCFDKEEKSYIALSALDELAQQCTAHVESFHKSNPLKGGIARSALASGWGKTMPAKLLHFLLERLIKQQTLSADGDLLRLPGHSVTLGAGQKDLRDRIITEYTAGGTTPPTLKELNATLGCTPKEMDTVLRLLLTDGTLVRVDESLYFHAGVIENLKQKVVAWFESHDNLDPAGFRESTGLSRKFAIPLLEHFDAARLTVRVGDKRILRVM